MLLEVEKLLLGKVMPKNLRAADEIRIAKPAWHICAGSGMLGNVLQEADGNASEEIVSSGVASLRIGTPTVEFINALNERIVSW